MSGFVQTIFDACWEALDPEVGRTSLEVERIVLDRWRNDKTMNPVLRWWRRVSFTALPYLWKLEEKQWARSEPIDNSNYRRLYFKTVAETLEKLI